MRDVQNDFLKRRQYVHMTTSKRGTKAAAQTPEPAAPEPFQTPVEARRERGRPPVHTEPWAKITVVLLDRHVAYLDRLAIDVRLKHGAAISRAELIRSFIEMVEQSKIEVTDAKTPQGITELLLGHIKGRK